MHQYCFLLALRQSSGLQCFDRAQGFFGGGTFGYSVVPPHTSECPFGYHVDRDSDFAFQGSLWFSTETEVDILIEKKISLKNCKSD